MGIPVKPDAAEEDDLRFVGHAHPEQERYAGDKLRKLCRAKGLVVTNTHTNTGPTFYPGPKGTPHTLDYIITSADFYQAAHQSTRVLERSGKILQLCHREIL